MDKRILSQLIEKSVTGNTLDGKKVAKIASGLTRTQLKIYIDGLKRFLKKHTVVVESAGKVNEKTKKEFTSLFKDKEVLFQQNPDLIVGTRIIDNDMIYEMNLKDTLRHMQQYIAQE